MEQLAIDYMKEFKCNEHRIVSSPGKFEAEMFYAPYFSMLVGLGHQTHVLYENDTCVDLFILEEEEKIFFKPHFDDVYAIAITYCEQGFAYLVHFETEKEYLEITGELQ